MVPGLGAFIDRIGTTAGKNYLVAGFYPVLVVTVACAFAALIVFPDTQAWWKSIGGEGQGTLDDMKLVVALLLVVALAGFVLWSLNTWLRELLQSPPLPSFILRRMEQYQHARRSILIKQLQSAMYDLARYRKFAGLDTPEAISQDWEKDHYKRHLWINQLYLAERRGTKLNKKLQAKMYDLTRFRNLAGLDTPEAISQNWGKDGYNGFQMVKKQARAIGRTMFWRSPVNFDDAQTYFVALRRQIFRLDLDVHTEAQQKKLATLKLKFQKLAQYARVKAQARVNKTLSEQSFRYPNEDSTLAPTAIGNMSELHRIYALKRFGMQIDLIWPRMRKLVAADQNLAAIVDEVKTKLDFAVVMTWLSGVFTFAWTLIIIFWAREYLLSFVWIITPAFIATILFYGTAITSFRAFSEALKSAIDLHRFDLLSALHIELPANAKDEHELWTQLSEEIVSLQFGDENYKHP